MSDLTSALGWGQAKKIYQVRTSSSEATRNSSFLLTDSLPSYPIPSTFQSFLEPWNDGTLSDQGALSGSNRGSMASTSGP